MNKSQLERYTKIVRDIKILESEIYDMEHTDMGTTTDTVMDYRSGTGVPTKIHGFQWPLYEQRLAELDRLRREKTEVEQFVEAISDPLTRKVFKLRIYQGLSWTRVAKMIGEQNEGYPRKHIYEKFLRKN